MPELSAIATYLQTNWGCIPPFLAFYKTQIVLILSAERKTKGRLEMRISTSKTLIVAMFTTTVGLQAATKPHSKSVVVDRPEVLPELAQRSSEAMFLHNTGGGQAFLYLEQDQGKTLAILDLTNSASIREVGRPSVGASSPYDFVRPVGDSAALIRYRDHSRFAIINFRKYKQPVLTATPELPGSATTRLVGPGTLLLTSSNGANAPAEDNRCAVIDVADRLKPTSLGVIHGVKAATGETRDGTMFLLGKDGLTVIRRPSVEEEYQLESTQTN